MDDEGQRLVHSIICVVLTVHSLAVAAHNLLPPHLGAKAYLVTNLSANKFTCTHRGATPVS